MDAPEFVGVVKQNRGLTHRFVETVKAKAKYKFYADQDRLYLRVDVNGSKRWIFRFSHRGRKHDIELPGGYPINSLLMAREWAIEQRRILVKGISPLDHRRGVADVAKSRKLFMEVMLSCVEAKRKSGTTESYCKDILRTIEKYAVPIQKLYLDQITKHHILNLLESIESSSTKWRCRVFIKMIWGYGKAHGFCSGDNPANYTENLKELGLGGKPQAKHYAALDYENAPAFYADLKAVQTQTSLFRKVAPEPLNWKSLALQFMMLTGMRPNTVLLAEWEEFNFETKIWTIPASSGRKIKIPFEIPLSRQALEILKLAHSYKRCNVVFRSIHNKPIWLGLTLNLLHKLRPGIEITQHGFRSCFRDWSGGETDFERDLLEESLTHSVGDETTRAYARKKRLRKHALLLQGWADYLYGEKNAPDSELP